MTVVDLICHHIELYCTICLYNIRTTEWHLRGRKSLNGCTKFISLPHWPFIFRLHTRCQLSALSSDSACLGEFEFCRLSWQGKFLPNFFFLRDEL